MVKIGLLAVLLSALILSPLGAAQPAVPAVTSAPDAPSYILINGSEAREADESESSRGPKFRFSFGFSSGGGC